eukprot:CAMPEP_0117743780 /NCGR_PEP_ID=MMETSP0947-20121206/6352_1 /TAXON_ID=44440 /ORGANISM="Chattonella subsalsa, Strain CCMP2191" /LENGTH=151 /DNA_ID=CAMNT_0005560573 /DNA_START=6 /DNA_END=461 /DNA_ORIENTATION=+
MDEKSSYSSYPVILEDKYKAECEELEESHFEKTIESQLNGKPILSPFLPTKSRDIESFISFTGLSESDTVVDIGCGDGRVLVAAAKLTGCRGVGVDIAEECLSLATKMASQEGVSSQLDFVCLDATDPDCWSQLQPLLDRATVLLCLSNPS